MKLEPNPLIIALDGLEVHRARALIELLRKHVWGFKFNDALHDPEIDDLYRVGGPDARFFMDVKLHDIPHTVANTIHRLCARRVPDMLTVHASGGPKMLEAAVEATNEASDGHTKVLAVTVLTSIDSDTCQSVYGDEVTHVVQRLATMARDAGCDGVVCSSWELALITGLGIPAIVPGVRPDWYATEELRQVPPDDQQRIAEPDEAMAGGATGLVIGRPIVHAVDPLQAVQKTLKEIGTA